MKTRNLKSIKNHSRQSKITKNQERWTENAKLIGKRANQILRQFHPKSCLPSHQGTLHLSIILHLQQRSIYSPSTCIRGEAQHTGSLPLRSISISNSSQLPPFTPHYQYTPGPATRLQELSQAVLKVRGKSACHLTLFWHRLS